MKDDDDDCCGGELGQCHTRCVLARWRFWRRAGMTRALQIVGSFTPGPEDSQQCDRRSLIEDIEAAIESERRRPQLSSAVVTARSPKDIRKERSRPPLGTKK